MVRIGTNKTERLDCIPASYQVIVTIRPKYACPKGRTGVLQAKRRRIFWTVAGPLRRYWRKSPYLSIPNIYR
ncbi:hypothetical protein A8A54_11290 [Brucella pseudogrignonensis]|nr:hypothetical protein A8A54_11290 [Brucella pseudogrignonensis]